MELTLKLKDITWIGKAYTQKSIISPYSYINDESFTEEDRQELINNGVLKEDGNFSETYIPLLNTLSVVNRFVICRASDGMISLQKKIFFTDEGTMVSAATYEDTMFFEMPPNNEEVDDLFINMSGASDSKSSDLNLEVNFNAALVFATVADLYRKEILKSFTEYTKYQITGVEKSVIINAVNEKKEKHNQKISSHVVSLVESEVPALSAQDIDNALQELVSKEVLKIEGTKVLLDGDGLLFAGSFLIVENYYKFIVGQELDNVVYQSSPVILQAGIKDLLYIDAEEENKILLVAISAKKLNLLKDEMLNKPHKIANA